MAATNPVQVALLPLSGVNPKIQSVSLDEVSDIALLNRDNPRRCNALVFGDIWPLPAARLESMAPQARNIVNVEQNATGQLASLVREVTGIRCDQSVLKYDGRQLSGAEIAARVKEACELSLIDQRKFRFMVDEVPNFALYIMGAMARRIRGMSQAM